MSLEFVEDHPIEEIQSLVHQVPAVNGWTFYFNEQPSDRVKRELVEELG